MENPLHAESQEPRHLGVYIRCHGELSTKPDKSLRYIRTPEGMTIHKHNLGGYGCSSYKIDHVIPNEQIAQILETGAFRGLSSREYVKQLQGLQFDKFGNIVDKANTCESFSGLNGWVRKKYTKDDKGYRYIILSLNGKQINLWDCTKEVLIDYLEIPKPLDPRIESKIDNFVLKKNGLDGFGERINTENLFDLFEIIKNIHGKDSINIFDESCNVVMDYSKKVTGHLICPNGIPDIESPLTTRHMPIPKGEVPARHRTTGYGGKTKRKSKRKRKTKRV
jgi:hypothetical protein